jgi:hypothetical protein
MLQCSLLVLSLNFHFYLLALLLIQQTRRINVAQVLASNNSSGTSAASAGKCSVSREREALLFFQMDTPEETLSTTYRSGRLIKGRLSRFFVECIQLSNQNAEHRSLADLLSVQVTLSCYGYIFMDSWFSRDRSDNDLSLHGLTLSREKTGWKGEQIVASCSIY